MIMQSLKWGTPLPKCKPYTHQMLKTFCIQAWALIKQDPLQHCLRFLTIFDWIHLGLFTGSRGMEYCQTAAQCHKFLKVPHNISLRAHAGEPIAFLLDNFCFLTIQDIIVSPLIGIQHPDQVIELQIRFRFDKSPINGQWRNICHTGHSYLCLVKASLSIVQWVAVLKVPANDPLGIYAWTGSHNPLHTYTHLCSTEVIKTMHGLVITAHPDPLHYLQQPDRLLCIHCHSARVTMCITLSEGNTSVEQIAHKLQWSVQLVKHYMRDCSHTVGSMTAKVIQGFHNV